jgi:hypothetical protein
MTTLRLRPDRLRWTEIDDELVIVDADTSTYLAANPAAAVLWRALARGATEQQLAGALADAYNLEPGRAAADVGAFLAELRERRCLEG